MKRLVILVIYVVVGLAATAQEQTPKYEVFGGYSAFFPDVFDARQAIHGWNASIGGNFNSWLGLKLDLSGHYRSFSGTRLMVHNYMLGPQFSYRAKHLTPFAHALFGGSNISGSGGANGFAMALGGGVDWNLNRNFGIRVAQADYLRTHFGGEWQQDTRVSTGVVLRWGE